MFWCLDVNAWLQIFMEVNQASSNAHKYLKTCWPIQEYVILHIWTCTHKVWSPWLTGSWVNYHDTCGFKITLNYFLHNYKQWRWIVSDIPHKASARFLFSTNSYIRNVVYGVNNTLSTSQGFCVKQQW
jgi:hypothetical protein